MYCDNAECKIFYRCKHWYGFYYKLGDKADCVHLGNGEVEIPDDCEVFETFPPPGILYENNKYRSR